MKVDDVDGYIKKHALALLQEGKISLPEKCAIDLEQDEGVGKPLEPEIKKQKSGLDIDLIESLLGVK
jgi:hypothetical protein